MQRITRGTLSMDVARAKAFMLRWSLHALEVPDREADAIIARLVDPLDTDT